MLNLEQEFIKQLKQQLIFEEKKQIRSGIYGFTQRNMAYNSNRIEGSTLTEYQTANIFETGTIMGENDMIYRTKDIEEMTGHFRMFNYMIQHLDEPLSVQQIKQMHYHLKVGVFEDMANGYPCGEFKNRRNYVSDIHVSAPDSVVKDMEGLLEDYHQKQRHTVSDLAKFHADYESIHPFQDGNGRTGRMILFKESLKNNHIPIMIQDRNKSEYIRCLHLAQTSENLRPLAQYFETEQKAYFEQAKEIVLPYDITNL